MDRTRMTLAQLFSTGATDRSAAREILGGKKIIVYGAGNGYLALQNTVLDRCGLRPSLVLDNKFKPGDTFQGIPAQSLSDFAPTADDKKNGVVVITIGDRETRQAVAQRLGAAGFARVIASSDLYEFNVHHLPPELEKEGPDFYARREKDIAAAMARLSDAESREVFLAVMRTYLTRQPGPVPAHPAREQYFPSDIPLRRGYARFIHCGAYDGDTVRQLQARQGKIEALACFEPDAKNFHSLTRYLQEHHGEIAQQVVAFPCGVFNEEIQLAFSRDQLLSSALSVKGDAMIQCVALDDVLPGFAPTFISMDIEGAEPEALAGTERLIRENTPDLAISVYHYPNHLWEIPLYLDRLGLGYRLYLRNYTGFTYETILYATTA
ncbi:MAG: FkbM family methyltransferase [Patescibacteria group bacterium]|nr:FkbM family methyltransferase [Patescibacteria group bacterium]